MCPWEPPEVRWSLGFSHGRCLPESAPIKILGFGLFRQRERAVRVMEVSRQPRISRKKCSPLTADVRGRQRPAWQGWGAVVACPYMEGRVPVWAGSPAALLLQSALGCVLLLRAGRRAKLRFGQDQSPSAQSSPASVLERLRNTVHVLFSTLLPVGGPGQEPSSYLPEIEVLSACYEGSPAWAWGGVRGGRGTPLAACR